MISVGIIGRGNWGSILRKKLVKIAKINFFVDSKTSFITQLPLVEWVFVATPDASHYSIVLKCLKRKKNVFCEKPLTLSYKKSKFLFEYARINKLKLYVDDIEKFKFKKFNLNKKNYVVRKKLGEGNHKSLLYRLVYHDLYLLYDKIRKYKIKKIDVFKNTNNLLFKIVYKNLEINFHYSIKSKEQIHKINKVNFLKFKSDPLMLMLKNVLYNKVDYKKNRNLSLFSNQIIEKIKKKII